MVSSMDGYNPGSGLLRSLSSDIASLGPSATYDAYIIEDLVKSKASRSDSSKTANAATRPADAAAKPSVQTGAAVEQQYAPPVIPTLKAVAAEQSAQTNEFTPALLLTNDLDREPAATKAPMTKTLAELVPAMRRATNAPDEAGPLSASRLDQSSSGRNALKLDAGALQAAMSFQPPQSDKVPVQTQASKEDGATRFLTRPEYTQFANKDLACNITHSFNLDGTSVKQTATEGAHRFWSIEKVARNDGSTCETLTCPMGKVRLSKETSGDSWSVTETAYESTLGKEGLWRSRVSVSASNGTKTDYIYSHGKAIAVEQRTLATS